MPGTALRERRPEDELLAAEEALFREARALRRRRWLIRSALVTVVLSVIAGIVAVTTAPGRAPAAARSPDAAAGLPAGQRAGLDVAGSLAVSPAGALYIADVARHRILVRQADGRFRVVAGTGVAGFSGDGGSALRARLSDVSDLTFSRAGDLYFVDGGRVRVITPEGIIHTVAGDVRPAHHVRSGRPARLAAFGSARSVAAGGNLAIALSATGELYIATQTQLLRLTPTGTLVAVPATVGSGPWRGDLRNVGQIAIDGHGDIDVSGVNGWFIWQVTPNGHAHQILALARLSGGGESNLQRAGDGSVYGENGQTLLRVTPHRLIPVLKFDGPIHHEYFWPTWFAFGSHGTTYVDELPGDSAFEAHQQLVAVHGPRITLLWQQHNHESHDSFGPQ